eukprot:m.204259 g.204259  ORF g.204259 m.204259 type:complete len:340 (+) comp15524_c0_seq56:1-1020(+)
MNVTLTNLTAALATERAHTAAMNATLTYLAAALADEQAHKSLINSTLTAALAQERARAILAESTLAMMIGALNTTAINTSIAVGQERTRAVAAEAMLAASIYASQASLSSALLPALLSLSESMLYAFPTLAALQAAGAVLGRNYTVFGNGVPALATYRIIEGVAYAISATPTTWNTFRNGWRYSGPGFARTTIPLTLAGNPQLSVFAFADSAWSTVAINTDFIEGVDNVCWYVRRRFYITAGSFSYSGVVDDDDAWFLIPPSAVPGNVSSVVYAGGNVADNNGDIDNAYTFTRRPVTVITPSVYIFAGRGCEGGGAEVMMINSIDSGLENFYEVLLPDY